MSLSIQKLTKSFGKKKIFSNFNYDFSKTGLYVIRGDSGIGKTTLLRIIAGLDKNYTGTVTDGGLTNVSFAFQEYRLFPQLTALQNIVEASFNVETPENTLTAQDMLKRLGFSDYDMQLFPSELSGGMKQRVSLARAFLRQAPILILDEPTKELDPALRDTVKEIIEEEATNRLVIMVTHTESDLFNLPLQEIRLDSPTANLQN